MDSDNEVTYESPATPDSAGKEEDLNLKHNKDRYRFRNEREEGEIESDANSSFGSSPVYTPQGVSERLFSEKIHSPNQEDFAHDSDDRSRSPSEDNKQKMLSVLSKELHEEIENDGEISRDAPEESLDRDSDHYKEVKLISSSDEEISNAGDDQNDSDLRAKQSNDSNAELSNVDDDHSESTTDAEKDDLSKREQETPESDVDSGDASNDEVSILVSNETGFDIEPNKYKKESISRLERRKYKSDSDTEEIFDSQKAKSLVFKKSKKSGERKAEKNSAEQVRREGDSEEAVVDHLDIAAPQQALLRKPKKKEKKQSADRAEVTRKERSSSKERKKGYRDERVRLDAREREKHRKYDALDGRKHRKSDKYDSSKEYQGQRPKSSVENKVTEGDLRRKPLQSRPKEEHKLKHAKERKEKNTKSDNVLSKANKEGKERIDEANEGKVRGGKERRPRKDHDKEKDKSGKNEKGRKRRREKSKPNQSKGKESDGSADEFAKGEDIKKSSTKRPRSSDRDIGSEFIDWKSDSKEQQSGEADYDDISPASSEIEFSPPPSPVELKKPTYYPAVMGCRDVRDFQWLNKIEEGTYGVVYRARDNRTNEIVALKRLKMEKEKEGFPITSLREINTLLKAQHPNIVTVREIVVGSNMDKIYIVMDYVEHDLKSLMETMKEPFLVGEVKTLMIQLLRGVNHMHDNWILHRDIKASNLLLSHKGILKIGDFGLAREYGSPLKSYTPIVVTLWYRAPELLLGGKEYKCAIDLWSVGCVFAELLLMKPLFPGKSEIDQINRIFKELGTPNDKIWPGSPAYSEYSMVKKTNFATHPYNVLRNRFGATFTDKGFNLLNRFLTYDPKKRITAEEALEHEYFEESPLPVEPSMFPTWPAKSELAHRALRKHNASPKAPEGGAAASKVANEDQSVGFHMPAATKGFSAKGAGFNLKF